MAKKKRTNRASSSLANRRIENGKIKSPLSSFSVPISWKSWKDAELPTVLWLCLLTTLDSRDQYLQLFRETSLAAYKAFGSNREGSLHHSFLATLSDAQFATLTAPLRRSKEAARVLSCLSVLDCLPDGMHWRKYFPINDSQDEETLWDTLVDAVGRNLFHQSEAAADVRWCKAFHVLISGRMHFSPHLSDRERCIREYPNRGDMKSVRPSIRAMEMSFREESLFEMYPDRSVPRFPVETFWQEVFDRTVCVPLSLKEETNQDISPEALLAELQTLRDALIGNFVEALIQSKVDARLDSSFGLVFYSLHITAEALVFGAHYGIHGRLSLRTLVEATIVLSYLRMKDDPLLWNQYRKYGSGRMALTFLKLLDSDELPSYVSLEILEELANEDGWFELQDIDIGSWAKKNLRQIAIEGGRKDIYDRFYEDVSGYVHGQWSAIQQSIFTTCANPLHRYHRIPIRVGRMHSTLKDACSLLNVQLEELSRLYSLTRLRIKSHKPEPNT